MLGIQTTRLCKCYQVISRETTCKIHKQLLGWYNNFSICIGPTAFGKFLCYLFHHQLIQKPLRGIPILGLQSGNKRVVSLITVRTKYDRPYY